MRDDHQPGDLSARLTFGRVFGTGPDAGQTRPILSITCETSGLTLELPLTAAQLADMLSGSAAYVPTDKVSGFRGIKNWGKYSRHVTRTVAAQQGDYATKIDARKLPHLASVIAEIEADGYRCDMPRRNNGGQWVIIGRKYVDKT